MEVAANLDVIMPLVTLQDLTIGYRGPLLLDSIDCQIEAGQRIGLLGRNGTGKTTLLRMLAGQVEPDAGHVTIDKQASVAMLDQDVPVHLRGSTEEIVVQGYCAPAVDDQHDSSWQAEQAVRQILSRMELDGQASFEQLSSGMKRRVLLARALVGDPDLLLLDEPTNHLDIDAIAWLEDFLARWPGTFIFVTHDRMFLRKLAVRILEIDRGQLFDWSCDYDTFLKRKAAALAAEDKQNALFDKKLAEEEAWIRQGIKARRTRNEGRVRALMQLRQERREQRSSTGKVNLKIQEGQRSGNLVAELKETSFAYEDAPIIESFSTTIMRGDKVGIIGQNGAGKTTLLRILLGQLAPQVGSVRLGTNLQIAYFDQLRDQLHDEATVQDCVGDGYDTIQLGGKSKHVMGYLQDFLFTPERARTPVKFLSGGERNRVLLAKLFAKPANVIVLDEPTNDLDTETLELLEEKLVSYEGTVLLVSHDREFLNNVVTSSIVFEKQGVKEYVGGFDDWQRQKPVDTASEPPAKLAKPRATNPTPKPSRQRLSFQQKRQLAELPAKIESLESEIATLHDVMAQPDFYQQPGDDIARESQRLQDLEAELAQKYATWEELESIGE